jgi:hypothetical protein
MIELKLGTLLLLIMGITLSGSLIESRVAAGQIGTSAVPDYAAPGPHRAPMPAFVPDRLSGFWRGNDDRGELDIELHITRNSDRSYTIQGFGACTPTPCIWGTGRLGIMRGDASIPPGFRARSTLQDNRGAKFYIVLESAGSRGSLILRLQTTFSDGSPPHFHNYNLIRSYRSQLAGGN